VPFVQRRADAARDPRLDARPLHPAGDVVKEDLPIRTTRVRRGLPRLTDKRLVDGGTARTPALQVRSSEGRGALCRIVLLRASRGGNDGIGRPKCSSNE